MPRWRLVSRTLILALAALLAGCVVAPYGTYYRPSSADPGATYSRAWCGGHAGPTTNIELSLGDGLRLSARAVRDYAERDREQLPLRLVLAVPAQTPVRFTADPLSIVETGSGRMIDASPTVRAVGRATLAPNATVVPRQLRPAGDAVLVFDPQAPHGQAYLRADGPAGFAPEAFTLTGPLVALDAVSVPFEAVLLRWPAGVRSPSEYRSDAEQALLVARAEACRRETPQRACDNLLEFGLSRSFAIDAGPLQWQGRWWRLSRRGGEATVAGELSLAVRSAASWRLSDNAIVLRQEGSDIEHTLRFDRLEVVFRDGIALDAPLHVDRAAGAGATEVHIEALLPADLPEFEVRLPPLQVASTRREIAPIRFERRRFDGGVEPLNC
jgi:hypothetical protein